MATKKTTTKVKKAASGKTAAKTAKKPAAKSASVKTAAKKTPATKAAKTSTKATTKAAAAPVKKPTPKTPKPVPLKPIFKRNEHVVYPSHGVGRVTDIEEREFAGTNLALYVINFEKDKMTLRVPLAKAKSIGMRRLSTPEVVDDALTTLRGRARIKRTMWSRRAQEYESKINSGSLLSLAEVVRDLHRGEGQPEQSYSERQLYEAAIDRMAREVAAVDGSGQDVAVKKLESVLHKDVAQPDKDAIQTDKDAVQTDKNVVPKV